MPSKLHQIRNFSSIWQIFKQKLTPGKSVKLGGNSQFSNLVLQTFAATICYDSQDCFTTSLWNESFTSNAAPSAISIKDQVVQCSKVFGYSLDGQISFVILSASYPSVVKTTSFVLRRCEPLHPHSQCASMVCPLSVRVRSPVGTIFLLEAISGCFLHL